MALQTYGKHQENINRIKKRRHRKQVNRNTTAQHVNPPLIRNQNYAIRANKPTCKKEWGKEHDKLRTCPQKNCQQTLQTIKKCQAHTKYHCRNKNVHKCLNKTTTKTDRRTKQGRGTPNIPGNIYKNRSHASGNWQNGYATHLENNTHRKVNKTQ